jgi:hypothetical protein
LKHKTGGEDGAFKKNTYPTLQKVMLMRKYGYRTDICRLSGWLQVPRSAYYYKHKTGKPGMRPSLYTLKSDGTLVSNEQVIDDINNPVRALCNVRL